MSISKSKIVILTTVSNRNLYSKSIQTHPIGIERIAIDGSKGLYGIDSLTFMFQKLKNTNFDWVIMADEDVFFINPEKIYNLIDYMNVNDYSICGVRDGGEINHRLHNPLAMNTFFLIINYGKLKTIWNKKEVLRTNKVDNKMEFDLKKLKYKYDINSHFEPYYCFFFWLSNKGLKLLYLGSKSPIDNDDLISNLVYDNNEDELLIHSWYARSYGVSEFHTNRIDNLIKLLNLFNLKGDYTVWNDVFFPIKLFFRKYNNKYLVKLVKRVSNKISKK